jgi:hypothetical protein
MCLKSGITKQHLLSISHAKFQKIYHTVNGVYGKAHYLAPSLLWINMSKNKNFLTMFGECLNTKFKKKTDSLTLYLITAGQM